MLLFIKISNQVEKRTALYSFYKFFHEIKVYSTSACEKAPKMKQGYTINIKKFQESRLPDFKFKYIQLQKNISRIFRGGGRNKVQLLKKHYKNIQGERNKVQFLKKYYKNIQGERNKVQVFAYQMSGTTQAVTSLINGIMANYF